MNRVCSSILRLLAVLTFGLFAAPVSEPAVAADNQLIRLGTSGTGTLSYQVGSILCARINIAHQQKNLLCMVEPTDGSLNVINGLKSGKLALGLVQADVAEEALAGAGRFRGQKPFAELRQLLTPYALYFTVLTGPKTGVTRFEEFRERSFNLGPLGSGTQVSVQEWLRALGWTTGDFSLVTMLDGEELGRSLCNGDVDGFMVASGLHQPLIERTINTCQARLVPLTGPAVDKVLATHASYLRLEIPGGAVANHPDPVPTYGVMAALVTTAGLSPVIVEEIVHDVFDDLDGLKTAHPQLSDLAPDVMVSALRKPPLHETAYKLYKQRDWID